MGEIMTPPDSDAYHVYHDWREADLSASIGVCLLEATDQELDNLGTPLYDVVNIEALETLLSPQDGNTGTVDQVRFTIDGHTVTVSSHEEIAHIIVHPGKTTFTEQLLS